MSDRCAPGRLCCVSALYVVLAVLLWTVGCVPQHVPASDAMRMLGAHRVVVKGAGKFTAYSSNYTGRIYANTDSTQITLLGNRLFVNDHSYGEIGDAATIIVDGDTVSIDKVVVAGSRLTPEEDLELDPWREYRTTFRGHVFVVRWRKGTIVGQVDPLFGHQYFAVDTDRYDIRDGKLVRNGKTVTSLRDGDTIHIEGPTVAIARGGTQLQTVPQSITASD